VEEFIRKQNIERYRRLLGENPTEAERKVLERLLAEEEARATKNPKKKVRERLLPAFTSRLACFRIDEMH
jgi:hypothetical protein